MIKIPLVSIKSDFHITKFFIRKLSNLKIQKSLVVSNIEIKNQTYPVMTTINS